MDFDFSEDQRLLQQAVRDFLEGECPPEWVRAQWQTDTGRDPAFWKRLAEVGVPGLLVPEAHGGLGLDETDLVLLLEETGRAALAEPVVATSVGAALLREIDGPLAATWLPKVASGDARLAVGHAGSPFVADAHVADLLFLSHEGALHAVPAERARVEAQPSIDGGQRLFLVGFDVGEPAADGDLARALQDAALDRGALCCAAEALGVADRLIALAVDYAGQRKQFGVAIGSFQAVKHMLADVKVELEYARSHVHRAAWSVAHAAATRAVDVSMAKLAACDAARAAARVSLQVHGAIGYTYEQDVHVWMKRAWSLDLAFGDSVFHRARLCAGVVDRTIPAAPFGFEPVNP
ncbi:MAG TPA: acyl-CoA dehydrogenase family protein [Myxococcota bacterium]|nr:acyl-CoA dehydrogenase family protein [Myxococcota bacterium]